MSTRKTVPWLFFALSAVALFLATQAPINSPDMFWHLKLGDDLVFKGISPFVDRYSFEFLGHHLKFISWFFDGLVALFFHFGQGIGLQIFRGACWIGASAVFFSILQKRVVDPSLQFLGFVFLVSAMIFHPEVRPEIGTFSFILIFFIFFCRARENPLPANLFFLAVILFFWVNFHTSCVFGFIMAGALYAELIFKNIGNRKNLVRYLIWGIGTFGVGFLNLDLAHPILAQLTFDDWGRYIVEYQKTPVSRMPIFFKVFAVLAGVTCVFTLANKRIAETIILFVLFFGALRMIRLAHFFVFVGTPFVVLALAEMEKWVNRKTRLRKTLLIPLSVCLLSLFVAMDTFHDFKLKKSLGAIGDFIPSYYPKDVVNYMVAKKYKGNVINQFAQGSYILWAAGPDIKVFLDGRTYILYPFSHLEKYIDIITHVEKLKMEADQYAVDYVIAPTTEAHALLDSAVSSGIFFLEYVGRENALLSRHFDKFRLWTLPFVHPECLTAAVWADLPIEYETAEKILPPSSPLISFFAAAQSYSEALDKQAYLKAAQPDDMDQINRLYAYLSIENRIPARALYFFNAMNAYSPADHLRIATLLCETAGCRGSENELAKLTSPRAQDIDFSRGYRQLLEMEAAGRLTEVGRGLKEQWKIFAGVKDALPLCRTP